MSAPRWALLQGLLLALIPVLTAHTAYHVLAFAETRYAVIFELRGVVLRLADLPHLLLLAVTLLRLALDQDYRQQLGATLAALRRARANWAWPALVVWMGLGILSARQPALAAYQTLATGGMLLMALVLAEWAWRAPRVWLAAPAALAAAFQALLAVLQTFSGGALGLGWLGEAAFSSARGQGLTFNPNTLAGALVIGAFMALAPGTFAGRRPAGAVLAVILAGLAATGSRGGLAAAAVGLALYFFLPRLPRMASWQRALAAALGVILAAALFAAATASAERGERLFFAFPGTLAALAAHPLAGVGGGGLMLWVDGLAAAGQIAVYEHSAHDLLQPAHNAYLALGAELGMAGLALFALGCAPLAQGLRRPQDAAVFTVTCALAAVGVVMLVEFHFWLDPHWRRVLFWLVGLWWGCRLRAERLSDPPAQPGVEVIAQAVADEVDA